MLSMYKLFNKIFNNIGFTSALTRFKKKEKQWDIFIFRKKFSSDCLQSISGGKLLLVSLLMNVMCVISLRLTQHSVNNSNRRNFGNSATCCIVICYKYGIIIVRYENVSVLDI